MIAEILTEYVIKKGVINKDEQDMYEYGFTLALEMGISILICLFIANAMHMFVEAILFFIIFIPIRSYAGGLHLKHFISCLCLSCLTFSAVLVVVRFIKIPILFSFCLTLFWEISIYFLYPVDNINRVLDNEERVYFKKKLNQFLALDFTIAVVCGLLEKGEYLLLIMTTFLMIVVTMILGKYKSRKLD